jgi:hypothetical protein
MPTRRGPLSRKPNSEARHVTPNEANLAAGAAGTVVAEGTARLIVCLVGPKLTERQMI